MSKEDLDIGAVKHGGRSNSTDFEGLTIFQFCLS